MYICMYDLIIFLCTDVEALSEHKFQLFGRIRIRIRRINVKSRIIMLENKRNHRPKKCLRVKCII